MEGFDMAFTQWWTFSEGMFSSDGDTPGVYEFANAAGDLIYVGSTRTLQTRLRQHLSEDAKTCIKRNAVKYRIEYRSDYAAEELRIFDAFVRQNGRKPMCNDIRPPG
jgi:hypothetical protein